jgi:hypothetical protein
MTQFDADDFDGGIQSGTPPDTSGTPPTDPNAPAGAGTGGDGQQQQEREGWIPRTRFDEVNGSLSQLRAENARLQALNEQRENIGRQLLGQPPAAPEDPYAARVKEQFFQLFPEMKEVLALLPHLKRVPDVMPQAEAQSEAFYSHLGTQHMGHLTTAAAAIYGEKLSPDQRSYLSEQFMGYLSKDKALQQRYLAGDPALASEFMQKYQAAMLDPVRRSALADQQRRANLVGRLPSRGPATAPIPGVKPPEIKTEDDRHEAAFNALVNSQG